MRRHYNEHEPDERVRRPDLLRGLRLPAWGFPYDNVYTPKAKTISQNLSKRGYPWLPLAPGTLLALGLPLGLALALALLLALACTKPPLIGGLGGRRTLNPKRVN